MNLYLFKNTDSSAIFGIGTYFNELISALENSTIRVHVVHLHSIFPEFEIVKTNNVENWYIPEVCNNNTFSGDTQKIEDYYQNVIYLLRLHIKDTKDLIFHFNYNQCQLLPKRLKAIFECKTITTIHYVKWALELQGNLFRLQNLKAKSENKRNTFEQLLYITDQYESLLYQEVDQLIVLSKNMQNILCSEYQIAPNKIFVIPNGLENATPIQLIDRGTIRKNWHILENEFVILFVGRLCVAKGLLFLIQAFRKLLDKILNIRLLIVGNGDYDTILEEAKDICTKVTFTGLLKKNELQELYRIADIGILPSLTEQCSYVIIEMLMHGIPIITTTASGLAEMTEDGISSLQVPVIEYPDRVEMDTTLLADKILYLLEHPTEAKRLRKNARKLYEERYSRDVFRNNMLNFYHSLYE